MIVFDKEADIYDSWYKTKTGNLIDQLETDLAIELLQPKPGSKVLDIGCGTGNYSIKLAQAGCKVVAIDVSQNMLDIAKKKTTELNLEIDFRLGKSENLVFPDNSFDAVVSVTAVEFFENVQKSFDEMFRVAKKGASIVVGTINKESSWGELYETESFQKNTVFKYANLVGKSELQSYYKEKLVDLQECLFFEPGTDEDILSMDLERSLSNKNRGGFICGLWKK
jgi:ubiquinone/menaquinone biosynthesis C-methylase UbiE